jgi:hypothetical protein
VTCLRHVVKLAEALLGSGAHLMVLERFCCSRHGDVRTTGGEVNYTMAKSSRLNVGYNTRRPITIFINSKTILSFLTILLLISNTFYTYFFYLTKRFLSCTLRWNSRKSFLMHRMVYIPKNIIKTLLID